MNTTNQSRTAKKLDVRKMTVIGMLSAISIIMSMTPIGYVPINPVANLTIMHIPVIIGAIVEGPLAGAFIGFIFGATSLIRAITGPTVTNFIFMNPLVSILPRMLIGIASYYTYIFVSKRFNKLLESKPKGNKLKTIPAAITGVVGTLVNTGGVLGMTYILYAQRFAEAFISANPNANVYSPAYIIFGIVGGNAVAEAILAAIIVGSVVTVLKTVKR